VRTRQTPEQRLVLVGLKAALEGAGKATVDVAKQPRVQLEARGRADFRVEVLGWADRSIETALGRNPLNRHVGDERLEPVGHFAHAPVLRQHVPEEDDALRLPDRRGVGAYPLPPDSGFSPPIETSNDEFSAGTL
jgi:hypothetical protein